MLLRDDQLIQPDIRWCPLLMSLFVYTWTSPFPPKNLSLVEFDITLPVTTWHHFPKANIDNIGCS